MSTEEGYDHDHEDLYKLKLEKGDDHVAVYSHTDKEDVEYSIIFNDSDRRITAFYEFSSAVYLPESEIVDLMMQKRNVKNFNGLLEFLDKLKNISEDPSVTSVYNWLMMYRSKLINAPIRSDGVRSIWIEYEGKDETFGFEIAFRPVIKIIRLYLVSIRSIVFPESVYNKLRKSAKEIKNMNDFLNFINMLNKVKSETS